MRILERDLDNEQLEIARASIDRSLLVIAGPGSGKTHLLTHVAAFHVRRSHPAPWRVLCLTFSVEAARQMRTRLAARSLEIPARHRIEVGNFHQIGSQLLAHHGHHIGWPREVEVLDAQDAQELAGQIAHELGLRALSGRNAQDAISRLRNNRQPETSAVPAESLAQLRAAYEARLEALRVRDFDDLILHTVRLLDERPDVAEIVRSTYRFVVVDELQDTSGWQLELVAKLTGEGSTPTFAVADTDQMVYGWRDARAENIQEWAGRFGAERVSLLGNYRCPPRIVEAANALISHNRPDEEEAREPYSRVTDRVGEILVIACGDEDDEAQTIASIVSVRLQEGVPADKIAVLASVGFLLDGPVAAMIRAGIRVVRVGDDPAAASPYARALRACLVFAGSPDPGRAQARLTALLGGGADAEAVGEFIETLPAQRSSDAIAVALAKFTDLPLDDEIVDRARQVIALAERETGVEPPAAIGRRIALDWHRLSRQLQREADAVKAMTTFVAKGLEFDTVIMPGFSDRLVPYVRAGTSLTDAWWTDKRREMYVAVTRTESQLYLLVRDGRAPSAFLAELAIAKGEHSRWE